jgi:hypothetical protein
MRVKVLAVAMGLVGVAGCNGGNGDSPGALTASERRYCTLAKQFTAPTFPSNPDPAEFSAIMTDYVAQNAQYFDDLLDVAPAEIKPDVEKAISTLRQLATGDMSAGDDVDLSKTNRWQEAHCQKG